MRICFVDLGYKGAIVEVPKTVFRYELYPKGLAIYASPENIAENEEYLKVISLCLISRVYKFHMKDAYSYYCILP